MSADRTRSARKSFVLFSPVVSNQPLQSLIVNIVEPFASIMIIFIRDEISALEAERSRNIFGPRRIAKHAGHRSQDSFPRVTGFADSLSESIIIFIVFLGVSRLIHSGISFRMSIRKLLEKHSLSI